MDVRQWDFELGSDVSCFFQQKMNLFSTRKEVFRKFAIYVKNFEDVLTGLALNAI